MRILTHDIFCSVVRIMVAVRTREYNNANLHF